MRDFQSKCCVHRPVAMQYTVLRCQREPGHGGDHTAYTERGGLVSWSANGKVRFWLNQRKERSAA